MIKLTKHSSCLGCKAYDDETKFCHLGYKTEYYDPHIEGGIHFLRPIEICPKPLSMRAFCDCNNKYYNKLIK